MPQTPGAILSGLNAPQQGRTAILAYHNGLLFTVPELPASEPGSDFQVRTWDISDPTDPVELATLGISPMPINAHGYFKSGDYLVIGPNWPPQAPWSFRAAAFGTVTRTDFPGLSGAGVRGNLFQPWFVGDTWWSYGEVGGDAVIELRGQELARWDHLGLTGVIGHPFLLGGLGSLVTRLGAGLAPQGVCVDPVSNRTFVKAVMDCGVTVHETDALFRLGDKTVSSTQVSTVAGETLAATVLAGKRIFYHAGDPRMSAEGYMSCATCHLDGGHDGRVWDFTGRGEGFRNTTTLHGRSGTGHGNVHWSANFDEIQDFENDIRGAFGGSGLMSDADFAATSDPLGTPKSGLSSDLDALAAYVASLGRESLPRSPFRAAGGAMTAAALAGRAHFLSLGCASCHAGNAFTDSTVGAATLHDVGTLRTSSGHRLGGPLEGIDTPTLLGVWATPPYFHDGSAATLEDVFRVAGGETLQAEDGTVASGAYVVDQYVDLNNDDTVHNRAFVFLETQGSRLILAGVDGGAGGIGALEIRYSLGWPSSLDVRVNGVVRNLALAPTGSVPDWRYTVWRSLRIEGVALAAGATNTIELTSSAPFPNVAVDDVLVTRPNEFALASPHRQVLALPAGAQAELLAYLRQLDAQPEINGSPSIFADGFESGTTSAWSATVP